MEWGQSRNDPPDSIASSKKNALFGVVRARSSIGVTVDGDRCRTMINDFFVWNMDGINPVEMVFNRINHPLIEIKIWQISWSREMDLSIDLHGPAI